MPQHKTGRVCETAGQRWCVCARDRSDRAWRRAAAARAAEEVHFMLVKGVGRLGELVLNARTARWQSER